MKNIITLCAIMGLIETGAVITMEIAPEETSKKLPADISKMIAQFSTHAATPQAGVQNLMNFLTASGNLKFLDDERSLLAILSALSANFHISPLEAAQLLNTPMAQKIAQNLTQFAQDTIAEWSKQKAAPGGIRSFLAFATEKTRSLPSYRTSILYYAAQQNLTETGVHNTPLGIGSAYYLRALIRGIKLMQNKTPENKMKLVIDATRLFIFSGLFNQEAQQAEAWKIAFAFPGFGEAIIKELLAAHFNPNIVVTPVGAPGPKRTPLDELIFKIGTTVDDQERNNLYQMLRNLLNAGFKGYAELPK